jgi:hypothetical protein
MEQREELASRWPWIALSLAAVAGEGVVLLLNQETSSKTASLVGVQTLLHQKPAYQGNDAPARLF